MSSRVGFRYCCDTVSFIAFVYGVLYFVICDGFGAFRASKWIHIALDAGQVEEHVMIKKSGNLSLGQVIKRASTISVDLKDEEETIQI